MKAILFDLDGTLLPLNIDQFMHLYFQEMSKIFEDLLNRDELVDKIMAATKAMILDTTDRRNESVFMETYDALVEEDLAIHRKKFDDFYKTTYNEAKVSSTMSAEMVRSVHLLKEKGYKILCVTNPLFPKAAILDRIRWAGLEPEDFDYITNFEANTSCKPQLKLYEEVLAHNDLVAEDCMMVGNDVQEDMIAGTLGMTTFLVEDYILHRTEDPIEVTYRGSAKDFLAFVESL